MLKKFLIAVLALMVGLQPLMANASDLGSAFSNLMSSGSAVSVSAPGRYSSGARNVFVGGGVEVRFPRSNATLFSIAPPSFSAGCQGISAHFGGFSFISGKQIEDLVRNIAQGAPGLVINMVIKALCPMCEAVLQNMQKLAQFAAKSNMDSCRIANNLVGMLGDKLNSNTAGGSEAVNAACSTRGAALDAGSDWGAVNTEVCTSMNTAVTKLQGWWKDMESGMYGTDGAPTGASSKGGGGTPTKQNTDAERCVYGLGNCAWLVLKQMYPDGTTTTSRQEANAKRLLLMNLMGTTLMSQGATCGEAADENQSSTVLDPKDKPVMTVKCLPKLEPRQVVGLFMCGNPGMATGESMNTLWKDYCSSMFRKQDSSTDLTGVLNDIAGLKLMDCHLMDGIDDGLKEYDKCETLKTRTVGEMSDLITGKGFLLEVQELLDEAVKRVRTNQSMATDDTGKKIITLINLAPYPLYQAINAAAVYPEAGSQLVDSLSLLVADHLAYAYFQQFLSYATDSSNAGVTIAPAMVERLANGMNALRMEADYNRARMGKTLATQQMVMEEIRKVNQVIQQSVMTEQMLNMQKYANTINTNTAEPSTSGK
jgi:hypothetical protein